MPLITKVKILVSVGSKKFGVGSLKRFEKQGGGEHTIVQIIENVFKKKPAGKRQQDLG